jgi:hypothetical protein
MTPMSLYLNLAPLRTASPQTTDEHWNKQRNGVTLCKFPRTGVHPKKINVQRSPCGPRSLPNWIHKS